VLSQKKRSLLKKQSGSVREIWLCEMFLAFAAICQNRLLGKWTLFLTVQMKKSFLLKIN